jgi:hypothetical protein
VREFSENDLLKGFGLTSDGSCDMGVGMPMQGDPPAADCID